MAPFQGLVLENRPRKSALVQYCTFLGYGLINLRPVYLDFQWNRRMIGMGRTPLIYCFYVNVRQQYYLAIHWISGNDRSSTLTGSSATWIECLICRVKQTSTSDYKISNAGKSSHPSTYHVRNIGRIHGNGTGNIYPDLNMALAVANPAVKSGHLSKTGHNHQARPTRPFDIT